MVVLLKHLEWLASRARMPLRWKFTIPISMLVFLLWILSLILVRSYMFNQLMHELEKRGQYIAQMLAERSASYILYEDDFELQNLLRSFPQADSDIAYAMLLRPDGSVMAHTFAGGFPTDLMTLHPYRITSTSIVRIHDTHGYLLDVAAPILGGRVGVARIGLHEQSVRDAATQSIQRISLLFLCTLVIGLLASFLLARFISHPIVRLSQTMQATELDSKLPPLSAHTGDEVGVLVEQFNRMVERLQGAHLRLKETQQQMLQTQKLEAISELAAGVAHEINNPIDGIRNGIRAIQRGNLSPERQELYFEMIHEAVERIETVVRDLAEHVRHQDWQWEELNLHALLEKCLGLVQDALDESQIELRWAGASEAAWVQGSEFALEQVLLNLVRNAIDAMPEGGELTVGLHPVDEDPGNEAVAGTEHAPSQPAAWLIEIRDTGVGIAEDQLPRLFDPFFSTKESHRARGLGLWVTRGLVEMHGGRIEFESQQHEGTCCRIFLPVRRERA